MQMCPCRHSGEDIEQEDSMLLKTCVQALLVMADTFFHEFIFTPPQSIEPYEQYDLLNFYVINSTTTYSFPVRTD